MPFFQAQIVLIFSEGGYMKLSIFSHPQLECGHVFHAHCCRTVLTRRWPGPRITFTFSMCPICKVSLTVEQDGLPILFCNTYSDVTILFVVVVVVFLLLFCYTF